MLRLAKFLLVALVAIVLLSFAFANRHIISVSFDPFASAGSPALAIAAPLFLVLMIALIIGVLAGGAAVWLSQGRFRRAARRQRTEIERLRAQSLNVPSVH